MKRTVDQRKNDVLRRILVAIRRAKNSKSDEERDLAHKWVRAWQIEHLTLSRASFLEFKHRSPRADPKGLAQDRKDQ